MKNTVSKGVILTLVALLFASSLIVLDAHAQTPSRIDIFTQVNGVPPPEGWDYVYQNVRYPVLDQFTLPAGGGNTTITDYEENYGYLYSISQGDITMPVEPIQEEISAEDFYNYNATSGSGFTPYMEFQKSKIYLYEDTTTGNLSLIIHHNVHLGPGNYNLNMNFTGLPVGAVLTLSDDPGNFNVIGGGVAVGIWMDGNRSDGGIIGGLGATQWTIRAYAAFNSGISAWEYQMPSGPIVLDVELPLIITAETVLLDNQYLITQIPKCGYETNILANDMTINASQVLVSVAPGEYAQVTFNNTMMPEADPQYSRSSINDPPPSNLGFQLPPNTPVPTQAAWNVDIFNDNNNELIDLVSGKPTAIFVNLKPSVQVNSQVYVSITIPGIGTYDKTVSSNAYASNNVISILSTPINLTTVGPYEIQGYYQVDGSALQYPLTPTLIYVKETAPLALYYTSLKKTDKSTDYGEETQVAFNEMGRYSNDFTKATYPVSLATLTSDLAWKTPIIGSVPQPKKSDPPEKGMAIDAMAVATNAYNAYGRYGKNYVGIGIGPRVTGRPDYFTYHKKQGAVGVSFGPGCKGVIVLDGYWDAAAHEIGHTYSLYWKPQDEEYNMPAYYPNGKTASGVWAQDNTWVTGYDFMGLAHYKKLDLTWINHDTYEALFKSMLTNPNIDPEVLWVSGIIYKNGTVEFPLSWYHYEQGAPDTIPPGDYALEFVASNGTTIATTSFDASFLMQIDPGFNIGQNINLTGFGRVEIEFAPFAFATVYPEETFEVRILNMTNTQNPIMATVNVTDIINVEPPYVFGGFLEPINPDGSSLFKLGRAVPVKFQLKDDQGNYVTSAVARITLDKISNYVVGTDPEPVSAGVGTEGNLFRFDPESNQYIFNLSTKSLSAGTWQICAVLDDGTTKTVIISLRG